MVDLKDKKVLVTGPNSMVGRAVTSSLKGRGAVVWPVFHEDIDLLDLHQTRHAFEIAEPDYVIHAAGWNGGIEWNKMYPADIFYRTSQMALNVLKCCEQYKVDKCLSILASCSYPNNQESVLREDTLWDGAPNGTVECHGLSKRILDAYSRQLRKQYGLNAITVVLTNSYGPHDSFDLEKTKVVGALIRKFVEAKKTNSPRVECWGTGSPKREFMFCNDAGEAIVQTLETYEGWIPLNIGTGIEVTIKELVEIIVEEVGYEGEVFWDASKPDGQMKKLLDTSKMKSILDVELIGLQEGIKETIDWYRRTTP